MQIIQNLKGHQRGGSQRHFERCIKMHGNQTGVHASCVQQVLPTGEEDNYSPSQHHWLPLGLCVRSQFMPWCVNFDFPDFIWNNIVIISLLLVIEIWHSLKSIEVLFWWWKHLPDLYYVLYKCYKKTVLCEIVHCLHIYSQL